ncbi:MAG: DEAD/DEAH box helicase family protein [Acidimicrobiales bacterium]
MSGGDLANPILNGPYGAPEAYFELGPGGPTGVVRAGRRPSESFIPIPVARKGRGRATAGEQQSFDADVTGERRELNSLINDIRRQVELWRARRYPGVTPVSRKLLEYWAAAPPEREDPVLFCQREAAETAVYLTEAAGRSGEPDFRTRVDEQNRIHNDGLPRIALKMATGSGKTVVMAMLIAWQTLNKVANPRDVRFAKRFLVVTPGITIRDRLRVIRPSEPANYYRVRDLVPAEMWRGLAEAEIEIVNYHAFLPRDAKEIRGVAGGTRRLLTYGKAVDPFRETPDAIATRVLRGFGDPKRVGEIVVLNDEAHHCYQDKPAVDPVELSLLDAAERKEAEARNVDARVWFKGLAAVRAKVGVKAVFDLSATPFYLKGSGWNEGYIFPWTVSDFSLMDAIESGIVKVPRIPVDDDAAGAQVTYLRLWDFVGKELPKRRHKADIDGVAWNPPEALQGALESLYRSYADAFARWERDLAPHGEPPPVFIVVCPNTVVSKLVYDWIAGTGTVPGRLPLLANADEYGTPCDRPRTILVDSAQLESGDLLSDEFRAAAGGEIEAFTRARRLRDGSLDDVTDADILREVMNTVGKPGELGEQVRAVVSVSMLTEGWDANTVSHILGVRRFGSQLLCEQVVGRGLRRRNYVVNEAGRFEPEYADVYGVPFLWVGDGPVTPGPDVPRRPAVHVHALPERAGLEIRFPRVDGYRIEVPEAPFVEDFGPRAAYHVERNEVAIDVELAGIVGEEAEISLAEYRSARPQQVAYALARTLVTRHYTVHDDAERPWLFPQLAAIAKRWLDEVVTYGPDAFCGLLLFAEAGHRAAEHLARDVVSYPDARPEILLPMIRVGDGEGSTAGVDFATRKVAVPATKSHVNLVVLDGPKGNSWEEQVADVLEHHHQVHSYVKNDRLGFEIPYVHEGRTRHYVPDFLVRLTPEPGDEVAERTLIVEVSGPEKSVHAPLSVEAKAATARGLWCRAVNHHRGFGRWGYVELTEMTHATSVLSAAIAELRADGPVTGLGD